MFTEGIYPIGDGLLDIDEGRLKSLLVPHDINDIYEVEQTPFARGKFAAVRRAIHKNSGVHFAAKFLKRRRRAQSSDKEIKHEIAVLMLCDGAENIVKLNAVHESRSDTALLLELATGGELQTFLDNEECLSEAHARICMREVLKALQFLHKRSIAHLDLKPQNILLTGERIEDGLKLCDFGISRVVAEGTNVREIVGTPDYVAPEVLQYEPLSLLTDIWSVGVLTYVLLSGFSPFGGETKQETFLNISQCALTFPEKLFGNVSPAAIDFVRRALRIKPNDRMTAAGCLEHIWLKDECSIDRQLFNGVAQKSKRTDIDVDGDGDGDEDDSIDDDEEEDEVSMEDSTGVNGVNGVNGSKMDSSDVEQEQEQELGQEMYNGKAKMHNGTKSPIKSIATTTTTAIITVPALRATTIPLTNLLNHQHQQRRHSSDSNKENTFMQANKPHTAATAATTNGIKKSTATSTIIIAPSESSSPLPNGGSAPNENNTSNATTTPAQCLFPDAPTTPKVIRKAPTTDTSPTSVKALVKKFQLEGNNSNVNGSTSNCNGSNCNGNGLTNGINNHVNTNANGNYHTPHLKETQQHHQSQEQSHTNGLSSDKKSTTAVIANGKSNTNTITAEKYPTIEQLKKFSQSPNSSNSNSIVHHSSIVINGRRSSEPITAVHKKSPITRTMLAASVPITTGAATDAVSYKSTCVLCLTCGSDNSGGINSGSSTQNATPTGCGHSVANSTTKAATTTPASASTTNGSISRKSSCSSIVNGSSATATTILFSSRQQLQSSHLHHPHHHHHHVVAKNAATANNLSLDQGIIC